MENLTRKQQAFAESMSANPDQTQTDAARAAGYAESGAKVTGCRLAQDPRVIAEIRRLRGGVVGMPVRDIEGTRCVPDGTDARRAWLVDLMCELADQRDNLNVAFKAADWLGRAYRVAAKIAEREDASRPDDSSEMDLDRARRIRKAARVA